MDVKRSWYVFEGDWGGQIYASVPAALVPNLTAGQAAAFLAACDEIAWSCNEGDGARWFMVADTGRLAPDFRGLSEEARNAAYLNMFEYEVADRESLAGTGMRPAHIYSWDVPLAFGLVGWKLVGGESGGMGGGSLLENDLWLHSEFLTHGLARVNRLRGLLGLAPLSSDVQVFADGETMPYAELMRRQCEDCPHRGECDVWKDDR